MDLTQLSDDELMNLFKQESASALGGGQSQGDNVFTGQTGKSPQIVNLPGTRAEGELKNELDIEKAKSMEGIKGPSGEVGGRIALARESTQRIRNVKRLLFPDGSPKSFKRELALGANLPGVTLPGFGRITPNKVGNVPFTEMDDSFVNDAQDLHRELGTILSGRQLIQTGVAARPEETQRLVEQFAPNVWSGAESAMNGLNQLEAFYDDYLKVIDPSGAKGANVVDENADPLGIR